ncbi:type II secretion system minor pseudopilin GspK [Pseudophaeobacter flagellatus]|uniref:type II secretion system minor pseudopilin GspK n=1 Tax=Pseudophaeobacter flagellatus TaxID=2899119 RepID=UPI001E555224|nr:type II secretion system minor pseudopilin GspK [Pseudophaeobacter flagellatus]MCD9149790.1 type II secretion system minor pseudopilin GspK [Pseudophaeobacter flagellatus]
MSPVRHTGGRSGDHGFVLVNALVLVAALAALATLLLARAEQGRSRLEAGLEADQLMLALDAYDTLALTQLARDGGSTDHLGEAWARPRPPLALERGEVSGQIRDLQGRFNINWLSNPDNPLAQAAFGRLLARLGLAPQIATEIRSFVTPGARSKGQSRWRQMDPPQDPVGGPLLSADQLTDLPGLSPRAYARLRPWITALPGDSRLNVNTAPPEVLASFLPDLPPAALARLLRLRDRSGFASVDSFLIAARLPQEDRSDNDAGTEDPPEETPASLGADQLAVQSQWFRVDSQARLNHSDARRISLLQRSTRGARPRLAWQVTYRP